NHPDVVVDGSGKAWLFYFTQQKGEDAKPDDPTWQRRSFLHVTELHEKNGILTVDRNAPAYLHMLPPPANKKSDGTAVIASNRAFVSATQSGPIRISSGVAAGMLVSQVQPVYRADAHVSGTVILDTQQFQRTET
ncbi:MAG TPA: hypothetical protein VF865_01605, partial [Acidobacteriaceae bacterium]